MIKGVIFDFNGTLFYDSDKHIRAFQKFFELKGLEVPSAEFIAKRTFGRTNHAIFSDIYRPDATEEELDSYGREKEALYRDECIASPETFHLAEGACEMLDFLSERGIPCAVATGSEIDNVNFYFEHLGIGKWFDLERIVYDNKTLPSKPAPDVYIEAARRIGLDPSECIVFEDGKSGLLSANAAKAGAVYAVVSEELESPVSDGITVDGEIPNFLCYEEILSKHGLI